MKNRVVGLEYVKAKDLVENEKNVKLHRKGQRDLFHKVLEKIGFAGAMVAYKNSEGKLVLVDGHMRVEEVGRDTEVPVLVLDLDETEADFLLGSYDQIGYLSGKHDEKVEKLLDDLKVDETLESLLKEIYNLSPENGKVEKKEQPKYEIVPDFDEGYDALIIFCKREFEWAKLQTELNLPLKTSRRGRIGVTHVLSYDEFMERWQKKL